MDHLRIPFVFGLFLLFIAQNKVVGKSRIWPEDIKCPDDKIHFTLFTTGNPNKTEIHKPQSLMFFDSKYDDVSQRKNKIIIHGYNESSDDYDIVRLKDEYLRHGNYNVWMIDWSYYADVRNNKDYIYEALSQVDHIGKCISELIRKFRICGWRNTIHIIGVGIGSHIAAYVSRHLERPHKIARITALDPALPFLDLWRLRHVYKGDAGFVDVLHTNAGFAGYLSPLGDVDFYLNGGIFQPGCPEDKVFFGCNHRRALSYFIESISSDTGFYGWYCTDYMQYLKNECPANEPEAIMGEHANKTLARYGIYIVPTKTEPPYAEGPQLLTNPSYVPVPLEKNIRFNVTDLIEFLNENEAMEEDDYDGMDHTLKCYRRIRGGFKFYNDEVTPEMEMAFGILC